ncbi:BTAD domain-containing putative transcriptional regulator [Streptomyces sp. NPDC007851]|uniref:AfsR/SARP family transcriptional regulator n=1 Tax=Streptomyces sp. NPDC007851 TaxID=3155008 RepID=UPI0033DA059D
MEFRLLGPVEARDGARRVPLSGSKVHTVLAVLLLARGRVVDDERLSRLLWGWNPPTTMNAQIYTYVSRLRKHLGPCVDLVRRQPGYQLITADAQVDVLEFERLERLGRKALEARRFEEAAGALHGALDLWQGPALANVTPFLTDAELPRLEEARNSALEHRIDADLELARHERLVPELTGLVAHFPVRERLRAQLMTALYRCGRQADALQVFQEGREVLAEELGVDPGHDLASTYQAVLSGELRLLPEPASAAVSVRSPQAAPPVMVPPALADFTGRRSELAELCARLAPAPGRSHAAGRARRILITGMAGVGKTALAVQAAHAVAGEFPDGLLHVQLRREDGTVKDCAAALGQLLRALGESCDDTSALAAGPEYQEDLTRRFRTRTMGRRLLILLDDVPDELPLDALLPATNDVAVVVTSRSRLFTMPGFRTVALDPMGTPESLALLAAVAGEPRILVEPEAAGVVAGACAGLPLALRAAASRLAARPHWPVARLARRLSDPAVRVGELRMGDLDVHRSLGSALGDLPSVERELACALAPGAGGTFGAAAAVAFGLSEEQAEDLLERLVEKSVLELAGIDADGAPLYRFHALMRLVAAGPHECRADMPLTGVS